MNRLKQMHEERNERPRAGDYYTIDTRADTFYVSSETAARVSRLLERRWVPRWMKFTDVNGARIWLRASTIESVRESTEAARGNDRAFNYARRKEEIADRRWDDDEY
jgi:hypothetical protein